MHPYKIVVVEKNTRILLIAMLHENLYTYASLVLAETVELKLELRGKRINASSDQHASDIESRKPCWGFPQARWGYPGVLFFLWGI